MKPIAFVNITMVTRKLNVPSHLVHNMYILLLEAFRLTYGRGGPRANFV